MGSYLQPVWDYVAGSPGALGHWFGTLNREEWIVMLVVASACGFVAMFASRSRTM